MAAGVPRRLRRLEMLNGRPGCRPSFGEILSEAYQRARAGLPPPPPNPESLARMSPAMRAAWARVIEGRKQDSAAVTTN